MSRPVRLKDIAESLGVDKSTVSLALRNHARIPPATRQRIQERAEQMGYRPDPALRRLSAMRWEGESGEKAVSLAFLSANREAYTQQYERLLPYLRANAEALGYGFETLFLSDYQTAEAAAHVLESRGVRGIIAMATPSQEIYQNFPWEKFSAVQVMSSRIHFSKLPVIRHDVFGTVINAAQRVLDAEVSSAAILLIGQEQDSVTDLRYRSAALLAQQWWRDAGMKDCGIYNIHPRPENNRSFAESLKQNLPEVLVVQNSGMFWMLNHAGIRIPEDLRLISLTHNAKAELASYGKSFAQIASAAVQQVDGYVRTDTRPPLEIPQVTVIADKWFPGASFPEPHATEVCTP